MSVLAASVTSRVQLAVGQLALGSLQEQVHDLRDLLLIERMEDDDLVYAVQQFRAEVLAQLLGDFGLHLLIQRVLLVRAGPDGHGFDVLAADVAGHNDHRVLEVHRAARAVGQASGVQKLQAGC